MSAPVAKTTHLPKTMKAAVATGFGSIDDKIEVDLSRSVPTNPKSGEMIVRVLACALAPGDVRTFRGYCDYMQMPPGGHPYIIGSDVSAVVAQVHPTETKFKVGDYVVCRFDEPKPNGGIAEYRLGKTWLSEICPKTIDPIVACGLPASAMAAKTVVQMYVEPKSRVLILGGSGAVGSSAIQYAKLFGADFVAAVSTQRDLCERLGADVVIDYRETNWWEVPEFQSNPFDVILDMVNGDNWTVGIVEASRKGKLAIKRNGNYACLMTGVATELNVHGPWTMFLFLFLELIPRLLCSKLNRKIPEWKIPEALKLNDGDLLALFEDVTSKKLIPLLDGSSPFAFTATGVRQAMKLQESKHAHGKVVVSVSSELME